MRRWLVIPQDLKKTKIHSSYETNKPMRQLIKCVFRRSKTARESSAGIRSSSSSSGGYAIPSNGAHALRSHSIYIRALKSCTRHPVRARTPRIRPGEIAVGPGCPAASAAEMKELIYLPESYNSLSTCIRTPPCSTATDPLLAPFLSLLRYTWLLFFSLLSSLHRSVHRLRPYRSYLNFSPYPPPPLLPPLLREERGLATPPFALSAPFSHGRTRA